jgi:sigma-B regulation protein RsbU (phosphoserine phosphatase)
LNPADSVAQLRHDLRTPVNQILGYSEMLEEDAAEGHCPAIIPDLKKIQSAARHLEHLISTRLQTSDLLSSTPAPFENTATPDTEHAIVPLTGSVLAVDDDPANLEILSRRLLRHGLTVSTALNGEEALAMLRSSPFDLVLLDVMMPGIDGYEVLSRLKADQRTRDIPVIMISALDELGSVIRCVEAGAEDYLPKPFNPTLLRARIGACLEKKSLHDAEKQYLQTIEKTQTRLDRELREAANYVRSIIPPPEDSPFRIDWKYEPSTELGGDAFGYHWIDDQHFAIYLLDVCGHGVGASLLSVTAISVIRSASLPATDFRDPRAVLSALNIAFPMERQNNMYFTIWYGVYHAPTRTLRHAGGGHPPALLLADGHCERLYSSGLLIGMNTDATYQEASHLVPPNATLLVLSDGCYEISDQEGTMLTFDEFEQFLQDHAARPDGLDALQSWVSQRSGAELDDDFSILRIQF